MSRSTRSGASGRPTPATACAARPADDVPSSLAEIAAGRACLQRASALHGRLAGLLPRANRRKRVALHVSISALLLCALSAAFASSAALASSAAAATTTTTTTESEPTTTESEPPAAEGITPAAPGRDDNVTLHAGFSPLRLGGETTIGFSFVIHSPPGTVPQPLIGIDLRMPEGLNAGTTDLGLATCTANRILIYGPEHCPANSLLGRGRALAVLPIAGEVIKEKVKVVLLAAVSKNAQLQILYSAEGYTPVAAYLVFRGEIVEGAKPPYGDELQTFIPPIPTLPEAPYASVVSMKASIGPKELLYYRRVHGKMVPFRPRGLLLPSSCPKGGFKFAATFTFLDGESRSAKTVVHCPRPARHAPRHGRHSS